MKMSKDIVEQEMLSCFSEIKFSTFQNVETKCACLFNDPL